MIHNSEHANLFLCLVFTLRLMISEFYLLSFKSETNEYSNALMMMTSSILLVKWFFTLMWFSTSMPCITCRRHQMHHESESASPQASLNWASQHASFQPLSRLLNPSYDPCPIPGLLASSSAISQRAVGSGQRYQILLHVEQVKKKTTAMWELHENSMHFSYGSGFLNAKCVI